MIELKLISLKDIYEVCYNLNIRKNYVEQIWKAPLWITHDAPLVHISPNQTQPHRYKGGSN